jgi:hypothetical protein
VAFANWNADTGITFFGDKDEYPFPIAGVCLSFVPGDRGIPIGPLIPDGRQDAENYICPSYRNSIFNKAVPATQRTSDRACHNARPGDKAVEVLQLRSTRYVYPPSPLRRTKTNDGLYFIENIGNILCNMDTQSCRLNTRVCTLGGCNSPTGTRLSGRITKADFNTRDRTDMKVVLDTMKVALWNSTNYIWTTCGVTRASPPSNSWIGDYGLTIQSGTFQVRLWRCPSPSSPTQPLLAEMIVSVQSEFDEAQVPRSGTVCSLNVTPIPSTVFESGYALSGGQCRL